MALTQAQEAHIAGVYPECRNEMAAYLAAGAEVVVQPQTEVGEAGAFAIKVVHSDFWIDCCDTVEHAHARARDLGLCVVDP